MLLAPQHAQPVVTVAGDDRWLEVGPVAHNGKLIAIHPGAYRVDSSEPRSEGRLRVETYQPLETKTLCLLMQVSQKNCSDGSVCMREPNWQFARDCAALMGSIYATAHGESCWHYWATCIEKRIALTVSNARAPPSVVTELGIWEQT